MRAFIALGYDERRAALLFAEDEAGAREILARGLGYTEEEAAGMGDRLAVEELREGTELGAFRGIFFGKHAGEVDGLMLAAPNGDLVDEEGERIP